MRPCSRSRRPPTTPPPRRSRRTSWTTCLDLPRPQHRGRHDDDLQAHHAAHRRRPGRHGRHALDAKLLNILIDPTSSSCSSWRASAASPTRCSTPASSCRGRWAAIALILALFGFSVPSPDQPRGRRAHRVRRRAPGRGGVGDEPRPHRHLGGDRPLCGGAHALPHARLRRGREPDPRDRHRHRVRRRPGVHRDQGRRGPPPACRGRGAGAAGLLGSARGRCRVPLRPRGQVLLRGELWEAEAEEGPGERRREEWIVDKVEGLTLYVSPAPPPTEGVTT